LSLAAKDYDIVPNPANERLKHRYFEWLRNARQMAEHSVEQTAMALDRFEEFSNRRDFKNLRVEQAEPFKRHLAKLKGRRSGEGLSKATITSTLYAVRDFVRCSPTRKASAQGWFGPMRTISTRHATTKLSRAARGG